METESGTRAFRTVTLLCALLSVALGFLTFVGWLSGLSILASIRAKYIPMAPSTALCFSLLGLGLVVQVIRPGLRWLSRFFAFIILLIAATKLVEFFGGYHFGIDAWFVRSPGMFGAVPTGRMAPMTALDFTFTGLGLLALTSHPPLPWTGLLGALALVLSAVVLIGYCYGTPLLYGGTIIPVALSTALAFFLCGIAIVAAAGPRQWPLRLFVDSSTRALLLRAFVPMIVVAALLNGWVNTTLLAHVRTNPAVIAAICAVAFAGLISWIVSQVSVGVGGRIDRAEAARQLAQEQLLDLNAQLETRVQERTRQLREKNEQMAEELRMARELQFALLPQQYPTVPAHVAADKSALRFLSLYFPTGDVSGDFFNVFPVGEKAVGIFICDVMGHGVRSALITGMIRALVEEHARNTADPGELLTRVNRALAVILKQAETTMFATCFYVVADVAKAELRFANAGHPCALHIRQGSIAAEKLQGEARSGPAMGIVPNASYHTATRPMNQGDLVMLFTDGLFEVEDPHGNLFSQDELQTAVSRHAALLPEEFFKRVLEDIRRFSQKECFEDDVCVVGMQVRHMV